jgi:hypothetical protein
MRRGLGAVCGALVFAAAASATSNFSDPIGDTTGPDIASAEISNSASHVIVKVAFANRPSLVSGDVVFVDFDLDHNAATGDAGVDAYAVFEGGEDPVAFVWRDGEFALDTDLTASFTAGAANVTVPIDLAGDTIGVSATALVGPDPEAAPTDHAPDSGAWTYTVERPLFQGATATFSPAQPHAGRPFAVDRVELEFTVAGTVDPSGWRCRAVLAGRTLRPEQFDSCHWQVPRTARGKRLAVTVTASYGDATYPLPVARFTVR